MGTALIYLLVVVVVAAVVYALAVAVFGRGEELPPLPDGETPTGLPGGRVAGADVRALRFPQAVRGYRMGEVDWVLERLAGEIERLGAERDTLAARLREAGAAGSAATPTGGWVLPEEYRRHTGGPDTGGPDRGPDTGGPTGGRHSLDPDRAAAERSPAEQLPTEQTSPERTHPEQTYPGQASPEQARAGRPPAPPGVGADPAGEPGPAPGPVDASDGPGAGPGSPGLDVPGPDVPSTEVPGLDVPGPAAPGPAAPGPAAPGPAAPGPAAPGSDAHDRRAGAAAEGLPDDGRDPDPAVSVARPRGAHRAQGAP
ncbi:DivIVA domain protein [Pseudonocardia dioxanivorans CB1190]|uniref:DivIVA domain protein n=1 Tax=Pseudonocardia dioxanivorans (strain ATCC 55486 / DSM 44775 / JCM 13855 / CB1190) TaxID=675635 RepID=F4CMD0_PSEUX|nr:DivIVA domain-containing protein [Pseudonocardia dioxanivorans]AEA23270.1 DivIVA domain protein [Pseudonocardia dioxanivorans CB1190]